MSDRERIRLLERDLRGAMAIIEREDNRNDVLNRFRAALQSIASNTCCDKCQEAALVAKSALERDP